MTYKYIGKSILRKEDKRFLSGTSRYVADIRLAGMAHAAILRSDQPHARIESIDCRAAAQLPGVLGVFTADDVGAVGRIPMRLAPREALRWCFQPPIAQGVVRYVGEPLALVVARDRYIAEDALEHIDVRYHPLAPVPDVTKGRARGAPRLHDSLTTNVAERIEMRFGQPEEAFAAAPLRLRAHFEIQRHTGVPIETRGVLAAYDAGTDLLTVWGAAKVPHFNRQILADLLGRPENSVRMIETDVGGGFGPRGEFYPEDFLIPWAAMKVGTPIRWIEDRREHLMATNHSREQKHDVEIGATLDGRITVMIVRGAVDMGAYIRTNGFVVPERAAAFIPGPYKIEHYLAEVDCVMTTKTPTGSYRGPGRYEASFVRERAVDLVARELGLDPGEVRLRNMATAGDMPYNVKTTAFGHDVVFDSGDYPATLRRALTWVDYDALRTAQSKARAEGRFVGIGLCAFVEKSGVGPFETARVRVDGLGHIEIHTGVTSVGQGVETVLAQICAEQLDIPPEKITVRHGDTGIIAMGAGAYGSRGTITGGSALWQASIKLRDKMLALCAHRFEVAVDQLVMEDGSIFVPGTDLRLSFREVAQAAMPGKPLPPGMEPGLDMSSVFVVGETAHPHGVHIAVVEVDIALGTIAIQKYMIAYDIGLAINPMLVEGQLVGGLAQGLGGAVLEELVYSSEAQLLTGSLADYLMPTATDMPLRVETLLLQDARSPHNPLGTKGAGEGGTVGAGAAIANAVDDALSPLGVRITRLPVSPNAIFELLREKGCRDGTAAMTNSQGKTRTNGITTSWRVKGDGPWLILSHSLACDHSMWDLQIDALAANYRLLLYDTRGHGGSDSTPGSYTLEMLADDLKALVDYFGIDRFGFVGLSMGGMIGQVFALRYPDMLNLLALCDTTSEYPPGASSIWAERIVTARKSGMSSLSGPTVERWFTDSFRQMQPGVIDSFVRQISATSVDGYVGCSDALLLINTTRRLRDIAVPTIVIVGEKDLGTPVAMARAIHENIRGSDMVIIPDAAHFPNVEQPHAFLSALLPFLLKNKTMMHR